MTEIHFSPLSCDVEWGAIALMTRYEMMNGATSTAERQVLLASDDNDDDEALAMRKLDSSLGDAEVEEALRVMRSLYAIIAILLTALASYYLFFSDVFAFSSSNDSYDSSELSLDLSNEYDSAPNLTLYPWLDDALLIEPHRETTFQIINSNKGVFGSRQCKYSWTVYNSGSSDDDMLDAMDRTGSTNGILHSVSDSYDDFLVYTHELGAGKVVLTVSEDCRDGSYFRAQSLALYAKYVRRELRSLLDRDREELLDAIDVLYNTSTVDGTALYGEAFKSVYYFTAVHVDGAGNPVCDEFHAGAGYLNNHVYMGNYFEQALQAVNPRVALHYYEYTRDFSSDNYLRHVSDQIDGGNWTDVLSDSYFGRSDPYSGEILNGRWAGLETPFASDYFYASQGVLLNETFFPDEEDEWLNKTNGDAHLRSPYGYLRPPWNYNNRASVSRFHNELRIADTSNLDPTLTDFFTGADCDDLEDFLREDVVGSPLNTYLTKVKNKHTKLHSSFGGNGGDRARSVFEELRTSYGFTEDDMLVLIEASTKFYKKYVPQKSYYADDEYPEYPLDCTDDPWDNDSQALKIDADTAPGDIDGPSCQCSAYYLKSEDNMRDLIDMYMDKFTRDDEIPQYYTTEKLWNLSFKKKKEVMSLLCDFMIFEGDFVASASPIDPIFWVSHGPVERLFQKIKSADLMADFDYTVESNCSGHAPWGVKKWLSGYWFIDSKVNVELLTNEQLLSVLDPTSDYYRDYIHYVYDNAEIGCEGVDAFF